MGYSFSLEDSKLIVTFDTENGRFSENIKEYSEPNLVLGEDRVFVKESGNYVQDFVLSDIDDIGGAVPENLIDAYNLLDALIKSIFVSGGGDSVQQEGEFTPARIPFTIDENTIGDSSKLTWNDALSLLEINGDTFLIKLKENINNRFITIGNPAIGSGSMVLKNQADKVLLYLQNPIAGASQAQFGIGDIASIPTESQLYVYGGTNGANIDMRGSPTRDEANMDFEGNDWATSPNSIGISYYGSAYAIGGTILGYPKNKLGVIRWGEADTAIIISNKALGVVPIRFGINDVEIANVNDKGLEYQSDFSVDNDENPRWIPDKEYVDGRIKYGATLVTMNGTDTVFDIPHGMGTIPTSFSISFGDATNLNFVQSNRAIDATNITITCNDAPIAGSQTVYWQVYK